MKPERLSPTALPALLALLLPLIQLQACAPVDIEPPGSRADDEYNARISQGIDTNASLRNPNSGHKVDRLFYNLNRVETMQRFQDRTHNALTSGQGDINPEHPSYRETARELSPFRQ